jgi:uncharacterized membrane protein YciS (DUF1049 family)
MILRVLFVVLLVAWVAVAALHLSNRSKLLALERDIVLQSGICLDAVERLKVWTGK